VLDLGCGTGLTSIFLAKEFGVKVFATDLWISASDNYRRFNEAGLEDSIIPVHAEAHELPYAGEYFDAAVSVDAYHYFGGDEKYMDEHLAPLVKKGGAYWR
jgi:cyclopropane fatty-acyl-phospholipid synthase-like methyltransferase